MRRARTFLLAIGAAILVVAGGGAALAQYPITGVDDCAESFEAGGSESTTFAPGDEIQVQGQAGCADPNEQDVEAFLESDPVLLARFDANADGSYASPFATIPNDTEPGAHDVVVRTSDDQYVQPITISGEGVPSGLPQTGRNIAVLALWGTLTLVLGSVLIGLTWRRWREARVTAEVEDGWADRVYAVGALERDAAPYRPQMTEWIDPPSRRGTASGADTASRADAAVEEEDGTPESDIVPRPDVPQDADGSPGGEARDVALRTSERTTEIVDRLRGDIAAWRR